MLAAGHHRFPPVAAAKAALAPSDHQALAGRLVVGLRCHRRAGERNKRSQPQHGLVRKNFDRRRNPVSLILFPPVLPPGPADRVRFWFVWPPYRTGTLSFKGRGKRENTALDKAVDILLPVDFLAGEPSFGGRGLQILVLRVDGLRVDRRILFGAKVLELVVEPIGHAHARGLDVDDRGHEAVARGPTLLLGDDVPRLLTIID